MKDYSPETWRAILHHNNLDSFDRLWALEVGWFEPRNQRRGGWSGVARCELDLPEGGKVTVFLKRQENHITRTLLRPFGMLTFVREMHNIQLFEKVSVPALEPVYFAVRKTEGNLRAILCTKALDDYESLEALVERWLAEGWPGRNLRLTLMKAVASVMNRMHDHKIQHNCFYPKHIFVHFDEDEISVRIIDLEKAKIRISRRIVPFRDLDTLNRHSQGWSRTDRLRFFLIYLGCKRLDNDAKTLWRQFAQRTGTKGLV